MENKKRDDHEVNEASVAPVKVDRSGFVNKEGNSPDRLSRRRSGIEYEREQRRIRKWRKMIGVGGSDWKHYVRRKPHIVKRRIRKGIPDSLRGYVWQLISGSRDLLLMNPGVYEGMGFVAGLLLLYMSEEDAFWLLVALLKGAVHAPMEGMYLVGLPLVQQYLFQFEHLVKALMPKLGDHFSKEMINPSMYASQWFITVFAYSFPFPLAIRIWDVFLNEGVIIVFKVGLALLKYCHDDLVKLPFERLMVALRNFPEDALDPDTLLPLAFPMEVSNQLVILKEEYEKQNGKRPPVSHDGQKQ